MRRDLLLLREMIHAASRIREVIGDLDADDLGADALRRDAVLWNYTVLGEASSQVSGELKETHPGVGWAQPTRLRNRIVHGYWATDLHILHDTASEDLPKMIDQLHDVLAGLDAPRDNGEDDDRTGRVTQG
ncbi:MAG TPA: HepT-like ribonuclease domain-containing protein [Candidatus Limnocylindrales bacterium]